MYKNKIQYKKIILTVYSCMICMVLLTGCGQKKDKNGSEMSDDGRSYGGQIQAEMKNTVGTAFFDVTVDSAFKYNTFQFADGLYQAESGKTYLSVKLTIKNTYEENLSMSIADFILDFEGNESKDIITGYGKTDLEQNDYMENLFTLKKGESITKAILFIVPDKEVYTLRYTEYYEDKFEGDSFLIKIKPELKLTASDTELKEEQAKTPSEEEEVQSDEQGE